MRKRKQMEFKVLLYVNIDEKRDMHVLQEQMARALDSIAGDPNNLEYAVVEYQSTNERID